MTTRLVVLAGLLLLAGSARADLSDLSVPVSDFSLTERSGKTITLGDLKGKVWVASFIMTYCTDGKCPQVTRTMQRLQEGLAGRRDVVLVTFTVDPKRDSLEKLKEYADTFDADPDRWLFLRGSEAEIDAVLKSVLLPGRAGEEPDKPLHAQKLLLIDQEGHLVAYFDGMDSPALPEGYFTQIQRGLRRNIDRLTMAKLPAWMPQDFPLLNATLNGLAGVLLLVGYTAIRASNVRAHMIAMLMAVVVSAVFLTSYLFYHLYVKGGQPTRFGWNCFDAPAWAAYAYHGVLISHTLLAIPTAPLALYVAYQGLRRRIQRHVSLARWVLPVWLYVSVTGVLVYWMLYRLYPAA